MLKKRSPFAIVKSVVFALILREVRGRFSLNRLGAFWFIFEPLAHVMLVLLLFTILRGRQTAGIDMPLFLIHGIVPFLLFRNLTLKGMVALNANRGLLSLLTYKQVKPFDMITARAIVETLLMACVFVLILAALGWFFDYDIRITRPLQWLGVLATGSALALGCALIFCVVIHALPELESVFRILFMPLYLVSGVIFPLWIIPKDFLPLLLWNPYLHLIELLREHSIAYYPRVAEVNLAYPATCAVLTLFIGLGLYRARALRLLAP